MKKQSFPGQPEEMPISPTRPEVQQPGDPAEPDLHRNEITEIPAEIPLKEDINKKSAR